MNHLPENSFQSVCESNLISGYECIKRLIVSVQKSLTLSRQAFQDACIHKEKDFYLSDIETLQNHLDLYVSMEIEYKKEINKR